MKCNFFKNNSSAVQNEGGCPCEDGMLCVGLYQQSTYYLVV